MTQIRSFLIGTALTAFAATGAVAQTSAQPEAAAAGQQMTAPGTGMAAPAAQGAQVVTPAPQRLTASGSIDPLVQKRDADSRANAEYRASKKASKAQLKEQQAAAKAQYKERVHDAKVNQKADKQAANNEMKMNMQGQTPVQEAGSDLRH